MDQWLVLSGKALGPGSAQQRCALQRVRDTETQAPAVTWARLSSAPLK